MDIARHARIYTTIIQLLQFHTWCARLLAVIRMRGSKLGAGCGGAGQCIGEGAAAQSAYARAEPLLVESVATSRRIWGETHSNTLSHITNLGTLRWKTRRFAEACTLMQEALAGKRNTLGHAHMHTLVQMNNMAGLLCDMGNLAAARTITAEALPPGLQNLGAESFFAPGKERARVSY